MALFLALLVDVSFANDRNTRTTITKRGSLPSYHPTASNSHSSSSHSSYHVTFTPVVPSASDNKYIYHDSQKDGTVFIAVGSCIGFIILASFGIWLFFAIRAWRSARQEYKIRALENKYQFDPFFFAGAPEPYDNATDVSDTDDSSDISEKIYKTKASRVSMYSLGSNSALNLLNQAQPPDTVVDPGATLTNASNMFISPTEMLKCQNNNRTTWNLAQPPQLGSESSIPNSNTSTPREQTITQIIGNQSLYSFPPILRNNYMSNTHPSLASTSPYANLTDDNNNDNSNNNTDGNNTLPIRTRGRGYRPPSMQLDTLLNHNL